jgi:integrase
MAGMNPAYVSRQMGHTNAKMFFEVYSKWIDGAANNLEKAKMDAWLNSQTEAHQKFA